MARALLSDINIQGHVVTLTHVLRSPLWNDFWQFLNLPVLTFQELGLHPRTKDSDLWHLCQREDYLLLTANRNREDDDSLEATIRAHGTATSLPVFTLADSERLMHSRNYADRVAGRLLECLLELDNYLGTGRVFLP